MARGGSVTFIPNWTPQTGQIDILWEDSELGLPRPTGKWFGPLAFIGGGGSQEGSWEWDPAAKSLDLWALVPGGEGHRHLIATLHNFTFPLTVSGTSGTGTLAPTLNLPVVGELSFTWRGVVNIGS